MPVHCLLLFLSILFLISVRSHATVFSSSLKSCQDQCAERNLAFPLARGELAWPADEFETCGYNCHLSSCHHGCHDLDESESKCSTRCQEEGISSNSCYQGCSTVERAFLVQVQDLVSEVAVSIDVIAGGTRLRWNFGETASARLQEIAAADVQWFAQIRTKSSAGGWKWYPLNPGAFRNNTLDAELLTPTEQSTQIRVRLAATFRSRVLVSHGVSYQIPSENVPIILELASQRQLAENKVAICWNSNRHEAKFRVSVATLDGNPLQTLETSEFCQLLRNLPSENCCRVSVSDITAPETPGPEIGTNIELKYSETDLLVSDNSDIPSGPLLIFTNGTTILRLSDVDDYVLSKDPAIVPFEVPPGDSLTALCPLSGNEFLVGTFLGSIWHVAIENNGTEVTSDVTVVKAVRGDGHIVAQMAYDPIQRYIYTVITDRGIERCPMDGGDCTFSPNTDSLNPVRQLAVDSVNGFLYFLGADHQVYRSEMFPIETKEEYTLTDVTQIQGCSFTGSIEFDSDQFELVVALKNGTILSYDVVSTELKQKRKQDIPEVSRIHQLGERLFWTRDKCGDTAMDDVCFYSEDVKREASEAESGTSHFGRYLYFGRLSDFMFLQKPASLFSLSAPESISMLSSDSQGRIEWKRPPRAHFEAPSISWQNSTYELFITTSDGTVEQRNTNLTEISYPLKAGEEYSVKIRYCVEELCSSFIQTADSAFHIFKNSPLVFLRKSAESIEGFDQTGTPIDYALAVGGSISADIRKPFAMDNTTLATFSVSHSESLLLRSAITSDSSSSDPVSFLSFPSIHHLAVMPNRALLFVASNYQIAAFRLTGTFDFMSYSCTPSALVECGEVVGLSADDVTGEIHFGLRYPNGSLALFESNQDDRTPHMLAESQNIPEVRQLVVVKEKIVFITAEGHIGYCDKRLGSLNIDQKLIAIDYILPLSMEHGTHMAKFSGEVAMSAEKKSELQWNVEPRQLLGKTLFKVSMFRDKTATQEGRCEVTSKNQLEVPAELLQTWNSAQRFEVNIEGITAWTTFGVNKSSLQAPVKPPSAPTNTRLYATQQKTVDGPRAIISFFWSAPLEWNGTPFQYILNCNKEDGTSQNEQLSSSVTHYAFAVKSGKVTCKVAAANEPSNIGDYSEPASIDSSELKPLVRLFAIDSTNALMAITNISSDEPPKREKRQMAQMEYQAIAFIGNDLFAVRKEPDSIQPLLVQIDTNDIDNIVHKVSIGGDVSRIEAMTSDWVGNRLLFVSGMALYQLSLDPFLTTSLLNPRKLIELSTGATDAKQLTFDPFKNTAYLLTRNGSLFALNLALEQELNLALAVPCLASQTVTWMMTEFAWNRASSPKIYALTWNGLIVVDLEENSKCNEVRIDWNKFGEKGLKAMSAFAIADKLFVFVTSSEMLIYGRETVVPIPIRNPPLRQILAVSQSSQPFPDRSCFSLPPSTGIQFSVVNEGKTGGFLEVQKPPPPNVCHSVSFPQTQYEVYFTRKNAEKVKHIRSFSDKIHVENGILDKETDYEVTVAWLNRYSSVSGISDTKPFRTGFGYPSAPRDLHAVPMTPDTVYLYWTLPETLNAPINEIKYKISQQASGLSSPSTIAVQEFTDGAFSPSPSDSAPCLSSPCRVKISNLRPSTEYKFWSTAIHNSHLNAQFLEDSEAISQEATARTRDIAGTLRPDNVTGSSILLRWNSLQAEQPPTSISVQYKEAGSGLEWKAPANASFEPNVTTILVLINNLLSATSYDYRFVAAYTGSYSIANKDISFKEDYYQGVQQIKTKAGVPTPPQSVEARRDEEGWIVSWIEPSSDGGSPITSYAVEMRQNKTSEWEIAERGLDGWKLWWRPAKTNKHQSEWEFRVRAANQEGFGPYANSTDNKAVKPGEESEGLSIYLVLLFVILGIILLMATIYCILRARRRAQLRRKAEDLDRNCITLAKIAHHAHNQPMSPEMNNELKNLPHVMKSDFQLLQKIGRGSFGEVWEGVADTLPMLAQKNIKIAVKQLQQGYDPSDRSKFMKEAILMNNFDHPNIVKLLGVCLDSNPLYLILELMEEGDLLGVLRRSARELQNEEFDLPSGGSSRLKLRDLVSMMVDIGRGGAYLEASSHVHRDLAARNCLVTIQNGHRVTKIADFGMARGVFDSNYYKVNGEDFLPLRWLAPESALEGRFSSKSDVWSFGVLLFEILSLGKVPYGEMTNEQVLSHLENKGTPTKPLCCPDQLYRLMQQCWSRDPLSRPTFSNLLEHFEALREYPEFQEDKPFPPSGGHYNEAFNVSQDSNSSDIKTPSMDHQFAARSYGGPERIIEPSRFDRLSSGSLSAKKKPSFVRSLRKEKPRPQPLPSPAQIDASYENSLRGSLPHSNDTSNTSVYDYGSSSFAASPSYSARVPVFSLASNLSYEAPQNRRGGLDLEHRHDEDVNLSSSWAPGSHIHHVEPVYNSQHSLQANHPQARPSLSGVSSQPVMRSKRAQQPSSSTHTYSNPRHSKVSQV